MEDKNIKAKNEYEKPQEKLEVNQTVILLVAVIAIVLVFVFLHK